MSRSVFWMRRALALAARAGVRTLPNPKVGAVLVCGGRCVGEGFHTAWGAPHAEVEALRRAGARARGADLYVTLEPCRHFGKTPPCTQAILRAGVRKVFVATLDPNPKVKGGGVHFLRRFGVKTAVGLLEEEAKKLQPDYFLAHRRKRPWVVLKAAVSLDGRLACKTGLSRWITGQKAREEARRLRAQADAVLVGSRTVLQDDPKLTVRLGRTFQRAPGWPLRVVLDSTLRIPKTARLLRNPRGVLLFTHVSASRRKEEVLRRMGARVERLPGRRHRLDLSLVLKRLYDLEVRRVLVEGGALVHTAFWEAGLADELVLFFAPKILGGVRAPSWIEGKGVDSPRRAIGRLVDPSFRAVGTDLQYHALTREGARCLRGLFKN